MHQLTAAEWAQFIQQHSDAHILQTPTWGALKTSFGWTPQYIQQGDLGAMVLFRRLPLGLSVAYIPRGPVGTGDWATFWHGVDELCRKQNAVFLRVEPEIWEPIKPDFISVNLPGFLETQQTIQPPRTVMVSLAEPEEEILAAMKSKTRYNIRLAERKDVVVKPSDDVAAFHRMMLTTGERDAFGIHSLAYYQKAYDLFAAEGKCALLIASYEEKPLAGLMVFVQGQTAWYLYGASTNEERNRMPTYLLQWEAMRWAKRQGCTQYDLWGVPDLSEKALEDQFTDRSDGLWGVYRFKRGFGGEVRRTIGAWDKVYRPALYRMYQIYTRSRREASA